MWPLLQVPLLQSKLVQCTLTTLAESQTVMPLSLVLA
jgi:hypothetical protein